MNWFNFQKHRCENTVKETENKIIAAPLTPIEEEKPKEEWMWVDGYKGTDENMRCLNYQFEMNKCFDISDDKKVELCSHGFHLCLKLPDVFKYYHIKNNNRFFKVKALVRVDSVYCEDYYGSICHVGMNNKLVAKSIIFTKELTPDEILNGRIPDDWNDEQKKMALRMGIVEAKNKIAFDHLVTLGYSNAFAQLCIDCEKTDMALAVGSQEGLSMDMKVWAILMRKD